MERHSVSFVARAIRGVLFRLRRLAPRRDHVFYRGCVLPDPLLRLNMCGDEYRVDEYYWESGNAEARRLVTKLGYVKDSEVVEIGSGLGRFAAGLLREVGDVRYLGFDAMKPSVEWCKKHIERKHPSFRFAHVNVRNEIYNPDGILLDKDFRFPVPQGQADIVYMWGVFTNMRLDDARVYISEISRLLRDGGRAFLTAFVEENVPPESINPSNYVDYECTAPLHVVRYQKEVLFSIFAEHGLAVEEFAYHGGQHCNQTEIYLRKVRGSVQS